MVKHHVDIILYKKKKNKIYVINIAVVTWTKSTGARAPMTTIRPVSVSGFDERIQKRLDFHTDIIWF